MEDDEMLLSRDEGELLSQIKESEYVPTQPRVKEYKQADVEIKEFADMSSILEGQPAQDSLHFSFDQTPTGNKSNNKNKKYLSKSKAITKSQYAKQEAYDNPSPSMTSSVKVKRKSNFEERRSEQVSFQRNIEMNRSMQHRATVQTSSKFQDFKDVFMNTRTLILYEEVIKLTELVSAFQKQITNLDLSFQSIVQDSEYFVSLILQFQENLTHFDLIGTETVYDKLLKENKSLLDDYQRIIDYLMSQISHKDLKKSEKKPLETIKQLNQCSQEDYLRIKPLLQMTDSEQKFNLLLQIYVKKCLQTNKATANFNTLLQQQEKKVSQSLPIQNFTETMKGYDRLSLPPKFIQSKSEVSEQLKKYPPYSELDIIQAIKDNLLVVEKWFQQTNLVSNLSKQYVTIDRLQELKLKANASFFTLAKIINSNFSNLVTVLSKFPKQKSMSILKECYRQCLQAVSRLRRIVTSLILNFGQTQKLHEQLNENHKFVTELSKIVYDRVVDFFQKI